MHDEGGRVMAERDARDEGEDAGERDEKRGGWFGGREGGNARERERR